MNRDVLLHRSQQVLHDTKWKKFLKRRAVFRHIPFINGVFASGSMAIGTVSPDSDFDVIVLAEYGRMFTARFFLILTLDILGFRRKNLDHGRSAADTICLNHFVTEKSYRLSPPHETYWKLLYANLVPVWGNEKVIDAFFKANEDWTGGAHILNDLRYKEEQGSWFKKCIELLLSGSLGAGIELLLKKIQLARIQNKLFPKAGYMPRLIATDKELELHLDTRRIEEWDASNQ